MATHRPGPQQLTAQPVALGYIFGLPTATVEMSVTAVSSSETLGKRKFYLLQADGANVQVLVQESGGSGSTYFMCWDGVDQVIRTTNDKYVLNAVTATGDTATLHISELNLHE